MDILKRILAKAKKFAFKQNPYNLKKVAREVSINDMGTLDEVEMEQIGEIMANFSDEENAAFTSGKSITLPDPMSVVGIPQEEQMVGTPRKDLTKDQDIKRKIIEYVNGNLELDESILFPSDIANAMVDRVGIAESVKEIVRELTGISPSDASIFVDNTLDNTLDVTEVGEKVPEEFPGEDVDKGSFTLVQKLMKSGIDIPKLIQTPIGNWIRKERLPYDSVEVMDWIINRNLGEPGINQKTGGKNRDYRAGYFLQHQEDFPEELFKIDAIRDVLRKYNVNTVNDLGLFKNKGGEGGGEPSAQMTTNLTNDLMEVAGQQLTVKLEELIETNSNKIGNWAKHGYANFKSEAQISGKQQYGDTPLGEDGGSMLAQEKSKILEPWEEIDIRDKAIAEGRDPDQAIADAEAGVEGGRVSLLTKEQRERGKVEAKEMEESNLQPLLRMFTKLYLQEVMKETYSLGKDIYNAMIKESERLDSKKGVKLGEKADRMLVYLGSAVKQITDFFNKAGSSRFDKNFNTEKGKEFYSYTDPTSRHHSIHIPRDALIILNKEVESRTGRKVEDQMEGEKISPLAVEVIRDVAKSSATQWQPDWRHWVRPGTLHPVLNNIGAIKYKIKDIYRKGPDLTPMQVYGYLSGADQKSLKESLQSDNIIAGFIDRTKKQPNSGEYSIDRNWLYAGRKGIGLDVGTTQKDKEKYINGIKNDPAMTQRQKVERIDEVEKAWVGLKNPRHSFLSDVVNMFPYMEKFKKEKKYSQPSFAAFLNLVRPHSSVIEGKGGRGLSGRAKGTESSTLQYYNLVGHEGIEDPITKLNLRYDKSVEERKKKDIRNNPELGEVAKTIKEEEVEEKYKRTRKGMELLWEYNVAVKKIEKYDDMVESKKEDIRKAYKKSRVEAIKAFEKELGRKLNPNAIKANEYRWTGEDGLPILDKKNLKRKNDAEKKIQEFIDDKEKLEINPEKSVRAVRKKIKEFKREIGYSLTDEEMRRFLDNIDKIAKSNAFRMIFAMYSRDVDRIDSLFKMAHQYSSIKIAGNVNDVVVMIEDILNKYDGIFN